MVRKKKRWGERGYRERNREGETERSQPESGMRSQRQQETQTGETQRLRDEERDNPERGKKLGERNQGKRTERQRQTEGDIIETPRK